jgi:hypothetical protein
VWLGTRLAEARGDFRNQHTVSLPWPAAVVWKEIIVGSKPFAASVATPTRAAGIAIVCVRGPPCLVKAEGSTLPSVKFGTAIDRKAFGSVVLSRNVRRFPLCEIQRARISSAGCLTSQSWRALSESRRPGRRENEAKACTAPNRTGMKVNLTAAWLPYRPATISAVSS